MLHKPVDIKLIILFILRHINRPIANYEICDIIIKHDLVEYFTIQQAINSMLDIGTLRYDDDVYILTDVGKEIISLFEDRLPYAVRELVSVDIKEYNKKIASGTVIKAEYTKDIIHGIVVDCSIIENGRMLLELKISAESIQQAQSICKNWKENYLSIYPKIIGTVSFND